MKQVPLKRKEREREREREGNKNATFITVFDSSSSSCPDNRNQIDWRRIKRPANSRASNQSTKERKKERKKKRKKERNEVSWDKTKEKRDHPLRNVLQPMPTNSTMASQKIEAIKTLIKSSTSFLSLEPMKIHPSISSLNFPLLLLRFTPFLSFFYQFDNWSINRIIHLPPFCYGFLSFRPEVFRPAGRKGREMRVLASRKESSCCGRGFCTDPLWHSPICWLICWLICPFIPVQRRASPQRQTETAFHRH